jgi:thioredoxin reductase
MSYYDYVIIGSGIAGLYTALLAKESGSVLILTKGSIDDLLMTAIQNMPREGSLLLSVKMTLRNYTSRTQWQQAMDYVTPMQYGF